VKPGAGARLAILISGRGSNLQAFIDACDHSILSAEIAVVISNNPGAEGLQKAAGAGIPTRCIDHRGYPSRESFDTALVEEVQRWQADAVILAGFMRILTPVFIRPFSGRLLNVHPSLLPKYPGLHTHQRALDAGDSQGGVTVHFVTLTTYYPGKGAHSTWRYGADAGRSCNRERAPDLPTGGAVANHRAP